MQEPNSYLRFKYMSINPKNIKQPFFISIDLLSPDRKPSKDNVTPHYNIILVANKNNFGHFDYM